MVPAVAFSYAQGPGLTAPPNAPKRAQVPRGEQARQGPKSAGWCRRGTARAGRGRVDRTLAARGVRARIAGPRGTPSAGPGHILGVPPRRRRGTWWARPGPWRAHCRRPGGPAGHGHGLARCVPARVCGSGSAKWPPHRRCRSYGQPPQAGLRQVRHDRIGGRCHGASPLLLPPISLTRCGAIGVILYFFFPYSGSFIRPAFRFASILDVRAIATPTEDFTTHRSRRIFLAIRAAEHDPTHNPRRFSTDRRLSRLRAGIGRLQG
jgi:hypothetical protein